MKIKIETKILKNMLECVKRGVINNETVYSGIHLKVSDRSFNAYNLWHGYSISRYY